MAPNIKDQLPILNRILQFFKREGLVIDSPLFRLHHQMSTVILMIGFIFISVENYLDTKAILCHTGAQFSAYAKSYCWIHGTAYVRSSLQGQATGCYVDQSRMTSEEDAPVTAYYLWLPYLLSLLFALAKLPHSMWKKFFESNLIGHILGGQNQNQNQSEHQNWGGFGPQSQMGGQGKNKKRFKSRPFEIAQNFVEFRSKYNHYHKKFALWEAMNIVTVLLSMQVTHWILNYKFWSYGWQVIDYIGSYGQRANQHDPMCELFPTEVACNINIGSTTGAMDRTNFLCILGNNLFNQKFFFVLWLWWVGLLLISGLGLFYRWARIVVPSFSRYLLARKVHGAQLNRLNLTSGDCFVLEMLVDNMTQTPELIDQMLEELQKKLGSNLYLKLSEVKDGYKGGDNFPLNTSEYVQENTPYGQENTPISTRVYGPPPLPPHQPNFPVSPENFSIYPTAPADV